MAVNTVDTAYQMLVAEGYLEARLLRRAYDAPVGPQIDRQLLPQLRLPLPVAVAEQLRAGVEQLLLDAAPGAEGEEEQLYDSLTRQIRSGQLRAGDRLPGKRSLAAQLAVAVNTVDTAYQILSVSIVPDTCIIALSNRAVKQTARRRANAMEQSKTSRMPDSAQRMFASVKLVTPPREMGIVTRR